MEWAKFGEYGLMGLVVGVLFFILWRMLIWVMGFVQKITDQQAVERSYWAKQIEALNNSIVLHNQGSIEARKMTEEAHRYQREEHIKMAEQNAEICKALVKMNGFKQ